MLIPAPYVITNPVTLGALEELADGPPNSGSSGTLSPSSFSSDDFIIFLLSVEYPGGESTADNTLSLTNGGSLTRAVAPAELAEASSSIYYTTGAGLNSSPSYSVTSSSSIARVKVIMYRIVDGASTVSLQDSAKDSAVNSSSASVTVNASLGHVVGIMYTGQDTGTHTWTGATKSADYINNGFYAGSWAYNDTSTSSSLTVSVSYATAQTNSQATDLSVAVFGV